MADRPPPTVFAYALASALIAGITGYFLGQGASIGLFGNAKPSPHKSASGKEKATSASDSSDFEEIDEDEDTAQELGEFKGNKEECKLVLVVRTDLGMTKGTSLFPYHYPETAGILFWGVFFCVQFRCTDDYVRNQARLQLSARTRHLRATSLSSLPTLPRPCLLAGSDMDR